MLDESDEITIHIVVIVGMNEDLDVLQIEKMVELDDLENDTIC